MKYNFRIKKLNPPHIHKDLRGKEVGWTSYWSIEYRLSGCSKGTRWQRIMMNQTKTEANRYFEDKVKLEIIVNASNMVIGTVNKVVK